MTGQRVALPFFGLDPLPWSRPALATFSSWNLQTAPAGNQPRTATATDNADGLPLVVTGGLYKTAPSGYFPTTLLKAAPTPPFTITVALAGFSMMVGSVYLPIVLYDTGGDIMSTWWWSSALGQTGIFRYSNASNATTATLQTPGGEASGNFTFPDYFAWFRVVNDGANTSYYCSPEGRLWKLMYTELSGAFLGTISKVGFGIDRANGIDPGIGSGGDVNISSILWSWIES